MAKLELEGTRIFTREGDEEGVLTGSTRRCQLEGCTGLRVRAVWPDGHWTWPCTKGLFWDDDKKAYQII